MRLAFLTPEYPNPNFSKSGGMGTSIQNLAESIASSNNTKVLVVVYGQSKTFNLVKNGVVVIGLKSQKYYIGGWYKHRRYINRQLNSIIKEYKIDLLEAPDWTGITAFMTFKIPLIIRMHGTDGYFCYLDGRKQLRKNRFFERIALKNADELVSVSKYTAKITSKVFKLKESIKIIPNCIDTKLFISEDVPINRYQILYFGTIARKKGVLELGSIFDLVLKKIPNASLLIVGKDNIDVLTGQSTMQLLRSKMSPLASKMTEYINEVPYNCIKKYILRSHVVVLPSFAEAFPMTWLETLALSKPLVSSNIGWSKELMINGETGFIANPTDHIAYANYIIRFLKDDSLCSALGKKGRDYVETNFSTETIKDRNFKYYQSVITKYKNI